MHTTQLSPEDKAQLAARIDTTKHSRELRVLGHVNFEPPDMHFPQAAQTLFHHGVVFPAGRTDPFHHEVVFPAGRTDLSTTKLKSYPDGI